MKTLFSLNGTVLTGDQHGRTIGYPTINLDPSLWPAHFQPGVYASTVVIKNTAFLGALYFGSRSIKGETRSVLEITLLDYSGNLYHQKVEVRVGDFIRPPIEYVPTKSDETKLQRQIQSDIREIRRKTVIDSESES